MSTLGTRIDSLEATRTKMRATLKKQAQEIETQAKLLGEYGVEIVELKDKLSSLTEVVEELQQLAYSKTKEQTVSPKALQAELKKESVKLPTTSLGSGVFTFSKAWILPLVVAAIFLLAGLGIYGGGAEPKYFVGISTSGDQIAMFETDKDSAESVASKVFWKQGDTRVDPNTGKNWILNNQNWKMLKDQAQTPAPAITRSRKPADVATPSPEQVNGNVTAHEEKNTGTEIDLTAK